MIPDTERPEITERLDAVESSEYPEPGCTCTPQAQEARNAIDLSKPIRQRDGQPVRNAVRVDDGINGKPSIQADYLRDDGWSSGLWPLDGWSFPGRELDTDLVNYEVPLTAEQARNTALEEAVDILEKEIADCEYELSQESQEFKWTWRNQVNLLRGMVVKIRARKTAPEGKPE